MLNFSKLTTAQKIAVVAILAAAGTWIALQVGVPIAEYFYGKNRLTDFLTKIGSSFEIVFAAIGFVIIIFQRIGVLPTIKNPTLGDSGFNPVNRFRNLAIWIVIALLLVFFFNLTQGSNGGGKLTDLLVSIFPMVLLVGVWIYIMVRMSKKKSDPPTS